MADLVPVLALLALLVVAYRNPSVRAETAVSVVAVAIVLGLGAVGLAHAGSAVRSLASVVAFLVTILVVAEICAVAGVFGAAAGVVGRASRGDPQALLLGVFVLAAAVTAVLSLDATVVLLTPVVIGAAGGLGTSSRPGAQACLRMANSASLLLPVSNLTNLLALPYLQLSFLGFALHLAPVLAVVLLVEYAGLRLLFRRELSAAPTAAPTAAPESTPASTDGPTSIRVPVVVVVLMLVGFAVGSPLGVEPFWASGAAAVVLGAWAGRRRLIGLPGVVRAAHPSFALFVFALGIVVAGLSSGFLGSDVARLVPGSTGWVGLLGIAGLATLLANVLTNLSATLLLVPLVAPLGDVAVLGALLGLNIGSGLTYSGSLANLLWRRGLADRGVRVSMREFHRVSLLITPVTLVSAVTVLWLVG